MPGRGVLFQFNTLRLKGSQIGGRDWLQNESACLARTEQSTVFLAIVLRDAENLELLSL